MATLTAAQLDELRQNCSASASGNIGAIKPQVNAALQAIEDYCENTAKAGFASAIEAAAPGIFNAGKKKILVAYYFRQKFTREGV